MLQFVGEWQLLVYGILVAVAAVYVPTGMLGLLQSGWRRFRSRTRRIPAEGAGVIRTPAAEEPERALAALTTTEARS